MSLLQIILFSLFSAIYAHVGTNITDNGLTSRILFGMRANIKDYPYFAGIHGCGAAIISDRWLVTAAHCVDSRIISTTVWVGGESVKNSQRYTFDKVIIHPEYKSIRFPVYDIALLRLSRPLRFSNTVKAIALPQQEYKLNAVYNFAGRGTDETGKESEQLMKTNFRTLETNECISGSSELVPHSELLKKVAICTRRTARYQPGICFGDSGSPLVQKNRYTRTLVGLASFLSLNGDDCHYSVRGMFTNVAPFVPWIISETKNTNTN